MSNSPEKSTPEKMSPQMDSQKYSISKNFKQTSAKYQHPSNIVEENDDEEGDKDEDSKIIKSTQDLNLINN